MAAPAENCIFLLDAQTGQGLAGIQHRNGETGDRGGKLSRACRCPGEGLKVIHGRALAGQQSGRRPLDQRQTLPGADGGAVGDLPTDGDPGIEHAKHRLEPGASAEDRGLARDQLGPRALIARDQGGGEIAGTDILLECGSDLGLDEVRVRKPGRKSRPARGIHLLVQFSHRKGPFVDSSTSHATGIGTRAGAEWECLITRISTPIAGHVTIMARGTGRPANLEEAMEYLATMVSNAGNRVTLDRRTRGRLILPTPARGTS